MSATAAPSRRKVARSPTLPSSTRKAVPLDAGQDGPEETRIEPPQSSPTPGRNDGRAYRPRLKPRDETSEIKGLARSNGADLGADDEDDLRASRGRPMSLADFLDEERVPRSPLRSPLTSARGSPIPHGLYDNLDIICKVACTLLTPATENAKGGSPFLGHMGRKWAGKRDSVQVSGPSNSNILRHGKGMSMMLKERKSRSSLLMAASMPNTDGMAATAVLSEAGMLTIHAQDSMEARIRMANLESTDIQLVHPSLFMRSHVLSLPSVNEPSALNSTPKTPGSSRFSTWTSSPKSSPSLVASPATARTTDRIYLAFADRSALRIFYATLLCCTKENGLPSDRGYRVWNGLEVSIIEGRALGEPQNPVTLPGSRTTPFGILRPGRDDMAAPLSSSPRSDKSFESRPNSSEGARHGSSRTSLAMNIGLENVDTYCELSIDDEVVARTAGIAATVSPLWREDISLGDLPALTHSFTIHVYQAPTRKSPLRTCIGFIAIPLADLSRSAALEEWWPIISRKGPQFEADHVGDLRLRVKLDNVAILPNDEYDELRALLNTDDDPQLPYDLLAEFPQHYERLSELLLHIYMVQGKATKRIGQMVETEIDGNATSAQLLFRGKSLLTKTLELYLRMMGGEWMQASLGEVVAAIVDGDVGLEIDPSKIRTTSDKVASTAEDAAELQRWVNRLWEQLYQARHRCPDELKKVFQHIQTVVEQRYDAQKANMRFTSISAFLFLRFFVPALLAPKLFGLTFAHPETPVQRTLTLVAKTLQGLANMRPFEKKEPYMSVLNGFVTDNMDSFVDYISFVTKPDSKAKPGPASLRAPMYQQAHSMRQDLPAGQQDRVPLLPHLLDEGKDLALLAAIVARSQRAMKRSTPVLGSPPSQVHGLAKPNWQSKGIGMLINKCIELHTRAEHLRGEARSRSPSIYRSKGSPEHTPPATNKASGPAGRSRGISNPASAKFVPETDCTIASRVIPIMSKAKPMRPGLPRSASANATLEQRA